ncbi:MAG: GGDEF domain-containing protein, partial [bacterium]|nr:GGDEF domain-containing protein [bacterium]
YGGDEFVIILPETTAEQATMISARLARTITRGSLDEGGSGAVTPISVSIGVANCPIHGTSGDELLHEADASMYAAKRAGEETSTQPSLG